LRQGDWSGEGTDSTEADPIRRTLRVESDPQRGGAAVGGIGDGSGDDNGLAVAIAVNTRVNFEQLLARPGGGHGTECQAGVVVIVSDRYRSGAGAGEVQRTVGGLVNAGVAAIIPQGDPVVEVDGGVGTTGCPKHAGAAFVREIGGIRGQQRASLDDGLASIGIIGVGERERAVPGLGEPTRSGDGTGVEGIGAPGGTHRGGGGIHASRDGNGAASRFVENHVLRPIGNEGLSGSATVLGPVGGGGVPSAAASRVPGEGRPRGSRQECRGCRQAQRQGEGASFQLVHSRVDPIWWFHDVCWFCVGVCFWGVVETVGGMAQAARHVRRADGNFLSSLCTLP